MNQLFGTDGIRTKANQPPLTPDILTKIGLSFSKFWKTNSDYQTCIIGHDGRKSSDLLVSSLGAGLMSGGFNIQDIDLCSTPTLSFLCKKRECAGGIMISASHNPYYDNGLKPFQSTGEKFFEEQENKIEEILHEENYEYITSKNVGHKFNRESWISDYLTELQSFDFTFPGHVVLDCANGGTSKIAPPAVNQFCKELSVINNEPNGVNINKNSGSLHLTSLKKTLKEKNADIGFAFDGDGDRIVALDENANKQNGDVILYQLSEYYSNQNRLPGNGIVLTTMSNLGLRRSLDLLDINYEIVGVGDKNVYKKMLKKNWKLGGEQSGHIINGDWLPTGDGLYTLLSILRACVYHAKPLSHWGNEVQKFPQILHNLDVDKKPPLSDLIDTQNEINSVENKLGKEGRVHVRYSGTEPVARIMLEGKDEERLTEYADSIATVMDKEIHEKDRKND